MRSNGYLYSSDSPNARRMSLNSFMTSRAAWYMSCKALSSFGFVKSCTSDNLLHH